MKWNLLIHLIVVLFFFSSCIEIVDDLSMNNDGSGTFKYTINLSSSKVKVNSILALDSLDGKKVPSIDDIASKINDVVLQLREMEGISNVIVENNFTDFIFKLQCDFESVEHLQRAIKDVVHFETKTEIPELNTPWLVFNSSTLVRSIPRMTIQKVSEIKKEDADLLKTGIYTSITRFESDVENFTNETAKKSKNNKAIMLRTNPYVLTQNPSLLDNTISIVNTQ